MPDTTIIEGWFWPTEARKAHYDGDDGVSLCGRWGRINPFSGRGAPLQGALDSPPSKNDCAACRRKLEARS